MSRMQSTIDAMPWARGDALAKDAAGRLFWISDVIWHPKGVITFEAQPDGYGDPILPLIQLTKEEESEARGRMASHDVPYAEMTWDEARQGCSESQYALSDWPWMDPCAKDACPFRQRGFWCPFGAGRGKKEFPFAGSAKAKRETFLRQGERIEDLWPKEAKEGGE